MMKAKYRLILFIPLFLIAACSGEEDKATPAQSGKEHFLTDQTRALEKAKEVEQMLQVEAAKNRQAIEKQIK